jgi:AraC-like DNA-binding protein
MLDWTKQGAETGPGVLAPAATGAARLIETYGGDVDRIFGRVGIPPEIIENPIQSLSLGAFCGLFEEAARVTQHDNFGLWFGHQFKPRDLGMWGYMAVCSPTVGSALENLIGHFESHQQGSVMRLREADNLLRLEYQITDGRILERRQDAELSLGMFFNVIRECYGTAWSPEEVHFEHPKPLDWMEHERAFEAPVYFNQPTNALLFRREALEGRMPNCDLKLMNLLQTCLSALGLSREVSQNLIDRLRNQVRIRLPEGYPSLDSIAQELGQSAAAIQRSLAFEGLSYKDLVENTRRDLAQVYLRQAHMALSEIAFLLGYSELSAFSRAFRRWYGLSPRDYRDQLSQR